jgi:AraC-like DNA-binding protein
MPLLTVLSHDSGVSGALRARLGQEHDVAEVRTWERLLWLVRERPVTGVVLDSAALAPPREPDVAVAELRRRFPSVSMVLVHRPQLDPMTLFRLGRVRLDGLALIHVDDVAGALHDAIRRSAGHSTEARVVRAIGPRLSRKTVAVVRLALNGVQLGWDTDHLASRAGVSRAHLSVRLRSDGLPSAGHLLLWAKLLHAGRWLADPARSAESISRQLEYSSGAAFRRALHNYVGGTPSEVRDGGGFDRVLQQFLDVCGVDARLPIGRSVA